MISKYSDMDAGAVPALDILREQDFRMLHVIRFNKATNESKYDGFSNALIRVFNSRSRADQAQRVSQRRGQ